MNYIAEINAFERWLETNYLSAVSQLLWYKLIMLFNRCGWSEWISVDNHRLMSLIQVNREATFLKIRDELIGTRLIQYQKGKRGTPGKYKINSLTFTSVYNPVPNSEVENAEKPEESHLTFTSVYNSVYNPVGNCVGSCVGNTATINKHKLKQNKEETEVSSLKAARDEKTKSTAVISLTLKTGEEYPVNQNQIAQWKELYPLVDVMQELREMKGWTDSNPAKRKTKTGILKFITGWLAREQERKEGANERYSSNPGKNPAADSEPVPEYGEVL